MSDSRIFVTGMGVVSPIGIGVADFWNALLAGKCGITPDPRLGDANVPWRISARIDDFDGRLFVKPKKALKVMCREIQFGYVAAMMAIEQAAGRPLPEHGFDPDRLGCVFGSETFQAELEELLPAFRVAGVEGAATPQTWGATALQQIPPLWMLKYLPNMAASHISIALDARGPNNTICQGDTSSAWAILEGADLIRRGWVDAAVVGGTSSRVSPVGMSYRGAKNLSQQHDDPSRAVRAMADDRCGTVHGEGAGALTLESADSVARRGATPLAELAGYARGFCPTSDANFYRIVADVARCACAMARVAPADLGHINLHAPGTIDEDFVEARAIRDLAPQTPLVALKRNLGHPGPSCSVIELIGSIAALQQARLPGVPHGCAEKILFDLPLNFAAREHNGRTCLKIALAESGQIIAIVIRI